MSPQHRKRKKTFNIPGHAHCLTYSCHKRLPPLCHDTSRHWVIKAMEAARQRHSIYIWAYAIMPDHVHLLVMPRTEQYSIQKLLFSLKRPVSWKAKRFLIAAHDSKWTDRLTVAKGPRTVFRFWQPGGGFDRNICSSKGIAQVAAYLHANPVRRGLVNEPTDWYWSSARWWAGDRAGPLEVDPVLVHD